VASTTTTDQGALRDLVQAALTGRAAAERALFDKLARHSGLPGTRVNMKIVEAFGDACLAMGPAVDAWLVRIATIDADRAPGGSPYEIVPVCGVYAIGLRARAEPTTIERALATFDAAADDLRFRVRDAVPVALAAIGEKHGDRLARLLVDWAAGYFQAAAALAALSSKEVLTHLHDAAATAELVTTSFRLVNEAPRSAERYPGYKALVEGLPRAFGPLVRALGSPVLETVEPWIQKKDPETRELAHACIGDKQMRARYSEHVERLEALFRAHAPKPRDAKKEIRPTRKRGKRG
jgi:hypothetical protein